MNANFRIGTTYRFTTEEAYIEGGDLKYVGFDKKHKEYVFRRGSLVQVIPRKYLNLFKVVYRSTK